MTNGSRTWRKRRGRCRARSRSATISHKIWQAENPDVLLGRTLLATVAPFPACPRTAVLRLALCPSLSRVSAFAFVLTRLHSIAIFSVHKIQALCFSKKFFESHFLLSFSPWNYLKSQVPCPRWWWVQALHFPCSCASQQQWQEILLTIEEAFPWTLHTLGLKFSPKYTKCKRNLISWNRSMENLAQVNANGHGLNNV